MGQFSASLRIEEIGREKWQIITPFEWRAESGTRVLVDAGFQTDLASVPQVLRSLVPKIGYWSQAAVIHDLLYFRHRTGLDDQLTRLQVDRFFREGIIDKARDYGVPSKLWRHWELYHAVRLAGASTWETPDEQAARIARQGDDTYE